MARIEIFRAGRFTPLQGGEIEFAAADLNATAAAYDPALFEAPLVVGHPKIEDPAYGWVKGLTVENGKLLADPRDVEPAFADAVNRGRFKKVSASFFAPDSKSNPKPGTYYLRHVGFLGATMPAVSGLKPVSFAADDADVVTVEFGTAEAGYATSLIANVFRNVREFFIAQFGQETADRTLPGDTIDALQRLAPQVATPDADPDDADPDATPAPAFAARASSEEVQLQQKELADREAKVKADQEALDKQRADFAARETAQRRADDDAFLEGLIKEGKVLPAEKPQLLAFMGALDPAGEISFAAPTGEVKAAQRDVFKNFVKAMPKRVEYAEKTPGGVQTVDFASATSIADAAAAYQAEQAKLGRTVDAATAVAYVTRGKQA